MGNASGCIRILSDDKTCFAYGLYSITLPSCIIKMMRYKFFRAVFLDKPDRAEYDIAHILRMQVLKDVYWLKSTLPQLAISCISGDNPVSYFG